MEEALDQLFDEYAHLFGDDLGVGLCEFLSELALVAFCYKRLILESEFHEICERWNLGADTSWDIYKILRDNKVLHFVPV
jgi:hypothetical protein